jgi:hypothetical protein
VQEAEFAVNVSDAVAAYWHVLPTITNVDRLSQEFLDEGNLTGLELDALPYKQLLLARAGSSLTLAKDWYFSCLRSSRDRDIRMIAELFVFAAKSAATATSRAHFRIRISSSTSIRTREDRLCLLAASRRQYYSD